VLPVTLSILQGAQTHTAEAYYRAQHKLMQLKRRSELEWAKMDVLLLPTAPTTYTIAAVQQDPVRLNSNMGVYTNFVNLFGLSAVAVPAAMRADGLAFGVTLVGPAFADDALLALGSRLHLQVRGRRRRVPTAERLTCRC
jgi:allophanate hydrolase